MSALIWAADFWPSFRSWFQVWLQRVWPPATIRRTISGCRCTFSPTRQNVAWTCCLASSHRIRGVCAGSGPSSKVSATPLPPVVIRLPFTLTFFAETGVAFLAVTVGFGFGFGLAFGVAAGLGAATNVAGGFF